MADPQQLALLLDPPRAYRNPFACVDCRVDTNRIDEYYAVRDDVWPLARLGGMLCVGCLERRIGRRLAPGDFIHRSREAFPWPASPRLADRLGSR